MIKTEHQLRCTCHRQPMLGIYGTNNGKPYIHVKVYKARRVYAEVIVTEGTALLFCRDCCRWNRITIRDQRPALECTATPAMVDVTG